MRILSAFLAVSLFLAFFFFHELSRSTTDTTTTPRSQSSLENFTLGVSIGDFTEAEVSAEVRVSANKRMISRPARRWPFIFPSSVVRVTPISDPECRSHSYNKTDQICRQARKTDEHLHARWEKTRQRWGRKKAADMVDIVNQVKSSKIWIS